MKSSYQIVSLQGVFRIAQCPDCSGPRRSRAGGVHGNEAGIRPGRHRAGWFPAIMEELAGLRGRAFRHQEECAEGRARVCRNGGRSANAGWRRLNTESDRDGAFAGRTIGARARQRGETRRRNRWNSGSTTRRCASAREIGGLGGSLTDALEVGRPRRPTAPAGASEKVTKSRLHDRVRGVGGNCCARSLPIAADPRVPYNPADRRAGRRSRFRSRTPGAAVTVPSPEAPGEALRIVHRRRLSSVGRAVAL